MRSRNIKPGFFLNEHLAQLSENAQLLFAGLWMLADREGRLEDRPLKIKAQIFPFKDINVDTLLNQLFKSEEKFITRYQVNEKKYIQINNFNRHQNPHKNEKPSEIPPPVYTDSSNYASAPVMAQTTRADSLIPDSLIPDSRERANSDSHEPPQKPSKKGTRLPKDWSPSTELIEWAKKERPDLDVIAESASFVDYWVAKPGQNGVKLDWDATFRNWIRRATQKQKKGTSHNLKPAKEYTDYGVSNF